MSHLQESADVATQILYDRTIVQLSFCAFRCGLIKEAPITPQDILGLLGYPTCQGITCSRRPPAAVSSIDTRAEESGETRRQRQLPFHMHINTGLLEAAFLVSSMLVEIPLLASIDSEEQKRKAISKPFGRLLDFVN
jgi:translation initiation factor 3 subunit C